jgi:hypothetical protein
MSSRVVLKLSSLSKAEQLARLDLCIGNRIAVRPATHLTVSGTLRSSVSLSSSHTMSALEE